MSAASTKRSANTPTTVVFIGGILGRLNALEEKHGSLRAVGRVLKIDPGYLSRMKSGEKLNPSDDVLRKLGLRRFVQFSPRVIDHPLVPPKHRPVA